MAERNRALIEVFIGRLHALISGEEQVPLSLHMLVDVIAISGQLAAKEENLSVKKGLYSFKHKALVKVFEMFESGDERIKVELRKVTTEEGEVERIFFVINRIGFGSYETRTKFKDLLNSGISARRLEDNVVRAK